jgi:hypothetical protein
MEMPVPVTGGLEDMIAVVVVGVRSSSSEVVVGWLLFSILVVTLIYTTAEFLITLQRDQDGIQEGFFRR